MMKNKKDIYTQKEKNLFWLALLIGIIGGLIGNLWVTYLFTSYDPSNLINSNSIFAVIYTIILLGILFYIKRQIKPIK